jgi:glucokinase
MALLGIDLGGTKLATGVFDTNGGIFQKRVSFLEDREGDEVGNLVAEEIKKAISLAVEKKSAVESIGICVPGIYNSKTRRVWAPNIRNWNDFPLADYLEEIIGDVPLKIDNDRTCYVLGEQWKGNAQGSENVIFLSVGTGIGAGIISDGNIIRGSKDIAGAIGWMAISRPYLTEYTDCGCFENYASGEGIARLAKKFLNEDDSYSGSLKTLQAISSSDIFEAFKTQDPIAKKVLAHCVESWGMAVANLVSLFNPEKIIFGGGVFGPASSLIPDILEEAKKWAQPISIQQVDLLASALGADAGIYGAGLLALKNLKNATQYNV